MWLQSPVQRIARSFGHMRSQLPHFRVIASPKYLTGKGLLEGCMACHTEGTTWPYPATRSLTDNRSRARQKGRRQKRIACPTRPATKVHEPAAAAATTEDADPR